MSFWICVLLEAVFFFNTIVTNNESVEQFFNTFCTNLHLFYLQMSLYLIEFDSMYLHSINFFEINSI
jgi:hypothetical protein